MNKAQTFSGLSATPPTEAELEAWNALTRAEQIARYREHLSHTDCDIPADGDMDELLAEARAEAARRRA